VDNIDLSDSLANSEIWCGQWFSLKCTNVHCTYMIIDVNAQLQTAVTNLSAARRKRSFLKGTYLTKRRTAFQYDSTFCEWPVVLVTHKKVCQSCWKFMFCLSVFCFGYFLGEVSMFDFMFLDDILLVTCCSFAVEMRSIGRPAHIVAALSARRFGLSAWTWCRFIMHV